MASCNLLPVTHDIGPAKDNSVGTSNCCDPSSGEALGGKGKRNFAQTINPARRRTKQQECACRCFQARELFDSDNHRIRPGEVFDAGFAETGFFHPADAVGARIIEATVCFDEHV